MPRSTMFCRVLLLLCLAPACAAGEADIGRPGPGLTSAPGIHVEEESSSGEGAGSSSGSTTGDESSSSTGAAEGSTSAALLETTTGDVTGEGSTSGSSSTGDVELGTSTGDESSSGGGSSTGEPPEPPAVCGDGVCEPSERASCWAWQDAKWADGFCYPDCGKDPACVAEIDCECTAEAAATKNWCNADPAPACSATAPGGLCSEPGGNVPGFYMWNSKCG